MISPKDVPIYISKSVTCQFLHKAAFQGEWDGCTLSTEPARLLIASNVCSHCPVYALSFCSWSALKTHFCFCLLEEFSTRLQPEVVGTL